MVAGWEGSDDWIRLQMQSYLLSLIATARADLKGSLEDFNEAFIADWKMSNNYRIWSCGNYPDLASTVPGFVLLNLSCNLQLYKVIWLHVNSYLCIFTIYVTLFCIIDFKFS